MGIDWHLARFLVGSSRSGASFRNTLTLGRQHLYVSPSEIGDMFKTYGAPSPTERELKDAVGEGNGYADGFLRLLGTEHLTTLDASDYEGASVVHDMNEPVASSVSAGPLRGTFDAVIDGGTLEHVFNFPTAVRNAMEFVKVGGHLFLGTPANNFFGHGFYQFSPELFYRVLSPDNGFMVERMIAYEAYPCGPWYEVSDPESVRSRVELTSSDHRVLLLVRAKRTHKATIFSRTPQQSDYVQAWRSETQNAVGSGSLPLEVGPCAREGRVRPLQRLTKALTALVGPHAGRLRARDAPPGRLGSCL